MQVICSMDSTVKKILGHQALKQKENCRMLLYCQKHNIEDGTLIYNLFTKEMILLSEQEEASIQNIDTCPQELSDYLISHWFLVPNDTDEMKLFQQVKTMAELIKKKKKYITSYTILPTSDCNARCFYCFELGRSRIPMSDQTALDVAQFIKKSCGPKTAKISWFGGEPLYNSRAIDIICDSLSEQGVKFKSKMVSNGYLFDEETIKKAKDKWELKSVQITLDGTEEVYNRAKAYIYKEGSAFECVINNIENLLREDIFVAIRLNVDMYNVDDLQKLCDYLYERFSKYPNITVYPSLLFEDENNPRTDKERKEIYEKFFELDDYIREKGMSSEAKVPIRFEINQCMADDDASVVISPEGDLGKCETYSESEFFGSIYSDEKDEEMIASWKERRPIMEECKKCKFYPGCSITLKKCPSYHPSCFEENRIDQERKSKIGMENTYRMLKKHKEKK